MVLVVTGSGKLFKHIPSYIRSACTGELEIARFG